jgi:SAM-dependent methyltransferase
VQPPPDRLSSSFGAAAAQYAEHRPDYAVAAVHWALELAPGRRVLDLGAGTGKLTTGLLELGLDVVAVEPDVAMLDELGRVLPTTRALQGSANEIPLGSASVDAVLAGNAMHWFDMQTAGPEIARVLSPGGVLAGLWNLMDDDVDWVAGLAEVGGAEAIGPRDTPASWRIHAAAMRLPHDGGPGRFGHPEQAVFAHGQRRTADSLVATFSTKAGLLVMSPAERDTRLAQIRRYLDSRPETAHGEFTLPMATGVLRTRRL